MLKLKALKQSNKVQNLSTIETGPFFYEKRRKSTEKYSKKHKELKILKIKGKDKKKKN